MIRLAHEKEIPGVPDGWLGVHIVKIVLFRNFTERGAERLQVDLHFFADGIPGHGNEAGVIFPFPQFFQCFVTIITMYPIRHDGHATSVKAT